MPNDKHDGADAIAASGTIHEDSSNTIQLSENTKTRLERLSGHRIDPALLKSPKGGPNFEGGYAIVTRAFLASSSNHAREQVVEPSGRDLNPDNRSAELQGDNGGEEPEGRNEEAKPKDNESDDETSGRWKGGGDSALPACKTNR
ncbi:hypothetical protein FS837_008701 [Tulasnella sp. UAMH 9824]|nr:hypothetical protein FS837_008701 [Tulasnella sp. UAMH 9824]